MAVEIPGCRFPPTVSRRVKLVVTEFKLKEVDGIVPCLILKRREARDALAKGGFGRIERAGFNGTV